MMRKTNIAPWTEQWEKQYSQEAERLKAVFGEDAIQIHHIGSTSVPAIAFAKPIIDLLVVVRDIQLVDGRNEAMLQLGYKARGERGIAGRRYFTKGGDERTHHVHIFGEHHPHAAKHLIFKAYLAAHPGEAREYGQLKLRLAGKYPGNTHLYQEGKQPYVNALMQRALVWAES